VFSIFYYLWVLCVSVAIETCRQQLSGTTTENNLHGQSESSEQTTSNEVPPPVFEDFFPIKRSVSSEDDEEQLSHKANGETMISNDSKKKSDWLSSFLLFNPTPYQPNKYLSIKKKKKKKKKKEKKERAFLLDFVIFVWLQRKF
jgi:hypothetical protein